jgi:hypothetical protein
VVGIGIVTDRSAKIDIDLQFGLGAARPNQDSARLTEVELDEILRSEPWRA